MCQKCYPATGTYPIPKKNILVLSCIDLRLTDDLLHFLHFDNLTNRYDLVTLAGASLSGLAAGERKHLFTNEAQTKYSFADWRTTLDEHIDIAVALHDIRDIYIAEHEDCGAYKQFLTKETLESTSEVDLHREFALVLGKELSKKEHVNNKGEHFHLSVHGFYIDLRGNVTHLCTIP